MVVEIPTTDLEQYVLGVVRTSTLNQAIVDLPDNNLKELTLCGVYLGLDDQQIAFMLCDIEAELKVRFGGANDEQIAGMTVDRFIGYISRLNPIMETIQAA